MIPALHGAYKSVQEVTDDHSILSSVSLFSTLQPEEITYLVSLLKKIDVSQGTVLIREGEQSDFFYIIHQGEIEVVKDLGTANERMLGVHGPGDFIGEMGLLNPDGLRTASVRASSPASLWEMHREDFDSLLNRKPHIAYEMVKTLSWRMSTTQNTVIEELKQKNRDLIRAYDELKDAQAQIIEKEKLERELEVAQEIQMSILPQILPELPGYDFCARIVPARMVGGDFYDLIPLNDGRMGILIGDVTDKGMPAAIFMARSHALLRAEAHRARSAGETLQVVNEHLLEMNLSGMFVTVLYGILDGETGIFEYARAGHELPFLCSAKGDRRILPMEPGQPLGILFQPLLDEGSVKLEAGCTLLLYTDGVTDIQDPRGGSFGENRLLNIGGIQPGKSAQDICDHILDVLTKFQSNAAQADDITIVAINKY